MAKSKSHVARSFNQATTEKAAVKQLNAVTKDMIEALENFEKSGKTPPWNKPWSGGGGAVINVVIGGKKYLVTGAPHNICSPGKAYSSPLNQIFLDFYSLDRGYKTNFWITPERIENLGAKVKEGRRCVYIFKYVGHTPIPQPLHHIEDIEDYERVLGITVLAPEPIEKHFKKAEEFAEILKQHGKMEFSEGSEQACYTPGEDKIYMPHLRAFIKKSNGFGKDGTNAEAHYWSTFFHESVHWTGHHSRCDRFGSEKNDLPQIDRAHYAKEELVAEMGAAYLCRYLGIQNELQHPEYIGSWIKTLKSSSGSSSVSRDHPLVRASTKATKAFNFLFDIVSSGRRATKKKKAPDDARKCENDVPFYFGTGTPAKPCRQLDYMR